MSQPKLVMIEGIPGAGKTSSARWVQAWLSGQGRDVRLRLEGDLDHPADYESCACLTRAAFAGLLDAFPAWRETLEGLAQARGGEVFLSYRKPRGLPPELWEALARRDVYDLPAPDFCRVTLARWEEFAVRAARQDCSYVFECCFLQNQLTTLMAVHDLDEAALTAQLGAIAQRLRPLGALLVYLDPLDLRAGLERAAAARPPEWLDFVVAYTTTQAWGKRRAAAGFDGLVRFYEARRALERRLFSRLGLDGLWLEVPGPDWSAPLSRLDAFLTTHFPA